MYTLIHAQHNRLRRREEKRKGIFSFPFGLAHWLSPRASVGGTGSRMALS